MCSNSRGRRKIRKAKRERKGAVRKYRLSASEGGDRVLFGWGRLSLERVRATGATGNWAWAERVVLLERGSSLREGGLCARICCDIFS